EFGYFFRFKNPKNPLHGAEANVMDCTVRPDGMLLCMVNMPGATTLTAAPICDDREADKEPIPNECCVRILGDESGQLICPGSAYDLLIVKVLRPLIKLQGILFASVEHLDLP